MVRLPQAGVAAVVRRQQIVRGLGGPGRIPQALLRPEHNARAVETTARRAEPPRQPVRPATQTGEESLPDRGAGGGLQLERQLQGLFTGGEIAVDLGQLPTLGTGVVQVEVQRRAGHGAGGGAGEGLK